MQIMIAASIMLILGMAGFISWNVLQQQKKAALLSSGITPPAGPQQGPIPAGLRFVFLRDGALWSAPTDGGTGVIRLTPQNTTVATNWVVRPALAGGQAGNRLAYIDLQQGFVHTIRSDAQNDLQIQQPLLKPGIVPSSLWDTETGATILSSLSWSKDGSTLAFLADPNGTGQTGLYLYTPGTDKVQQVSIPLPGSVSHPVWSPDGIRIAFTLNHNGAVSILDYNTQNHGMLTIASIASTHSNAADTVLTLDWSPDTDTAIITWNVGTPGHIHSLWSQRVGAEIVRQPHLLAQGDYSQATYSRTGHAGVGSWLVVKSLNGRLSDLFSIDLSASVWPSGPPMEHVSATSTHSHQEPALFTSFISSQATMR
jgi:hypothetical protein